jgi:hypothetical protein
VQAARRLVAGFYARLCLQRLCLVTTRTKYVVVAFQSLMLAILTHSRFNVIIHAGFSAAIFHASRVETARSPEKVEKRAFPRSPGPGHALQAGWGNSGHDDEQTTKDGQLVYTHQQPPIYPSRCQRSSSQARSASSSQADTPERRPSSSLERKRAQRRETTLMLSSLV